MIQSVEKAMKILSILSDNHCKPLPLQEIAKTADIPKSTCSHILATLARQGYVLRVSYTDGYMLGPQTYYLTRYGKYEDDLISLCRPVMRWLHKKSGQSIILAVAQAEKKYVLEYIDTDNNLPFGNATIVADDIYRTATGRVLLANMERSEARAVYDKYGSPKSDHWPEVTSWESLCLALDKIRPKDIICTQNSHHLEQRLLTGYGKAFFKDSRCMGALGIAVGPMPEEPQAWKETDKLYRKLLTTAANEITRRLSYQ